MDSNNLLDDPEFYDVSLPDDFKRLARFEKFLLQSRPLLSQVFRYIQTHYHQAISLREVAQAVGRSPAYLTNLMRQETGKTVLSWIIERRMVEACRLLVETDQSVEQIAQTVGYFDRRHFSRQFFRLHQQTPQAWRRKNTHQVPLLHSDQLESQSENVIEQEVTKMTDTEAQRLQDCMQEIVEILNNKNADAEVFALEGIEQGSVAKTGDGLIQITFAQLYPVEKKGKQLTR